MKYITNNHFGHGEPLRHADEDYSTWNDPEGCFFPTVVAIIFGIIIMLVCTCSCSRTFVDERPVYLHDTLNIIQTRIDSVIRDRDVIREIITKGDTVYNNTIERIVERKTKELHDTIVETKVVPIEVKKTTIKKVEKELSFLQKTMINIGCLSLLAIIGLVIYYIVRERARIFFKKL